MYRATDLTTGGPVAIKVLRTGGGAAMNDRLQREADLLAGIEHSQIVRHVAHGVLDRGDVYLAIEWLEGETLAARLGRGRLTAAQSVGASRFRTTLHTQLWDEVHAT